MPEFVLDYGSSEAAAMFDKLDAFTQGYIEAMFFTSTGHMEDLEMGAATVAELAPETLADIKCECGDFGENISVQATEWNGHWSDIRSNKGESLISKQAGRDFWYTRNGHGCGFWDGDWPEPYASALTKVAKSFRGVDLYRGDDGQLYLS